MERRDGLFDIIYKTISKGVIEMEPFMIKIEELQPSQLYISRKKLEKVQRWFTPTDPSSYNPIPIKKLDDRIIITDGHTRIYVAYLEAVDEIKVEWDIDDLDWDIYRICVDWCLEEGITTISNLEGRLLESDQYQTLWIDRCQKIQQQT